MDVPHPSRNSLRRAGAAASPHLELAYARSRRSLRQRLDRLRTKSWQIGQCAVAAGVAWAIAVHVFDRPTPFFAPIVAVISLGTSYGQRLRRVVEMTIGVAIGVALGDVFTHLFGSGSWQVALIVAVAMTSALLLDAGVLLVNQAAVQAIVVCLLLPEDGQALSRWFDAVIGGGVALVAATLVPRAPLRRPREQAATAVEKISEMLRSAADSIEDGDVQRALGSLQSARQTDDLITELRAAADEGLDVIASSPFRVRHKGQVRRMSELVEPLDFAVRNTRVLVRRVAVAAYRREHIPAVYAVLLRDVAECTDLMAEELKADRMASGVREQIIRLGRNSACIERTRDLSAEVVLAQVRSLLADLLAVSGMDPLESTDAIAPVGPPPT